MSSLLLSVAAASAAPLASPNPLVTTGATLTIGGAAIVGFGGVMAIGDTIGCISLSGPPDPTTCHPSPAEGILTVGIVVAASGPPLLAAGTLWAHRSLVGAGYRSSGAPGVIGAALAGIEVAALVVSVAVPSVPGEVGSFGAAAWIGSAALGFQQSDLNRRRLRDPPVEVRLIPSAPGGPGLTIAGQW